MATQPIDYDALAAKARIGPSAPSVPAPKQEIDYDALAATARGNDASGQSAPERFLSSAWSTIKGPVSAAADWLHDPSGARGIGEGLAAVDQAREIMKREGVGEGDPRVAALLDKAMGAKTPTPVAGQAVPFGTEPVLQATGQALSGDIAGGAGTLAGSAVLGAAAASAPGMARGVRSAAAKPRGPVGPVLTALGDAIPIPAVKLGTSIANVGRKFNEWRNPLPLAPPPRPTTAPPPIQGSNAPPLPSARAQVGAPPVQGSNAPPLQPARPQVTPPPVQGSNAPPPPVAPAQGPPALRAAGPTRGPKLPVKWNKVAAETETAAEAGPPAPTPAEPQAGPPQPPKSQGGAATPPPNTITSGAGMSAYDNAPGKFATTDEVAQFAKANGVPYEEAAKGFAQAGNKVLDRGGLFREIHDPRYGGVGGHPEVKAQFHKIYPNLKSMSEATPAQLATFLRQVVLKQAMGEFAKGGVVSSPPIGHYPAPPRQKWQGPPMTNWTPPPERTGPPARMAR